MRRVIFTVVILTACTVWGQTTISSTGEAADLRLPDSPGAVRFSGVPSAWESSLTPDADGGTEPATAAIANGPRPPGVAWGAATGQALEWLTIQSVGNLAMNKWVRLAFFHGHWFQNWMRAVERFRFNRWNDDDTFICDYIGHPIMGAVINYTFIQNDPAGRGLEFAMSRPYWKSRMKAMAWSAFWSAEWKLGPISEASIGAQGSYYYYDTDAKKVTNGTGLVDFFVTPVGGTAWQMGEDAIDRYIVERVERRSTRPLVLFAVSWLTPARAAANLIRFKAPWYRDSREVKAGRRLVREAKAQP